MIVSDERLWGDRGLTEKSRQEQEQEQAVRGTLLSHVSQNVLIKNSESTRCGLRAANTWHAEKQRSKLGVVA